MHIRTVATILMLLVLALLILNKFLRSGYMWLISIAIMIVAVIVYFIPRLSERAKSCQKHVTPQKLENCARIQAKKM